jgi:hypothetical protein
VHRRTIPALWSGVAGSAAFRARRVALRLVLDGPDPGVRVYGSQVAVQPFVRLNVAGVQYAAALRYQTW